MRLAAKAATPSALSALAAIMPVTWSPIVIYFGITLILGLLDWTGLARAVRSKLLALREEDFCVAAELMGAKPRRIIGRHLLPSFMSHLIASATLSCGGLRLDPRAARASVNGEPLRLTSLEYRLLHYMMMHQGRVISRTELVEHLYDQDFDRDSNTIEVFIGRVRKKVGSDRIETVRGLGYRLTPLAGESDPA